MSTIKIYNTHIEVRPYKKNDNREIEKMFSKWDDVTHSYIPIGYYIEDSTLYLPKGANISILANSFKAIPVNANTNNRGLKLEDKFSMRFEPRDKIQSDAIDFLTQENNFIHGKKFNQFGLNLDTGAGKTFCMIYAISKLKGKTIIITHKTRLKEQWISEFINKTDISEKSILNITGAEVIKKIMNDELSADIYVVNHQTLHSYATNTEFDHETFGSRLKDFFDKIKVKIKVIDEAHKFFTNSLLIDFFSNVEMNFYLTATFGRSDPKEVKIYNKAYSSLYRFGEETINYEEHRKHIVLCIVLYRSRPTPLDIDRIVGGSYGFNSYRYIDYALKEDPNKSMIKVIKKVLDRTKHIEGKTLITSPKIESVEMITNMIKNDMGIENAVSVHSKIDKEENTLNIKYSKIISSTIKGIGEGDDIKGLRILINTEPIGSKALVDQLRGRLREYSPDEDTYMFYLIDASIEYTQQMFNRIKSVFAKKCKAIYTINLDV